MPFVDNMWTRMRMVFYLSVLSELLIMSNLILTEADSKSQKQPFN